MQLALLWVAATTIALAVSGCFGPKLVGGDQCTADQQCPGSLTCVDGFCCESDEPCGGGDDAGVDGPEPDAEVPAFTEHETEFVCNAGTPNTLFLLKFDDTEGTTYENSCNPQENGSVVVEKTPEPGRFGMGVRVGENTEYVRHAENDPQVLSQLTIEAWIKPTALPTVGDAIIASRLHANGGTILQAAWALTVTPGGNLQFDFFRNGAQCNNRLARATTAPGSIVVGELRHVRAALDGEKVTLYINGFPRATADVPAGERCLMVLDAKLQIGNLENDSPQSGSPGYAPFSGVIDELRYSNVALPLGQ